MQVVVVVLPAEIWAINPMFLVCSIGYFLGILG